jgi:HSP20 family protein
LEAKDLDVPISRGRLVIQGAKRQETEQKDKNYQVIECAYGSFQHGFAVPEGVVRDKIATDLLKGLLTVILPKTAEVQKPPKKVEVKG